jgi:hypothetical protein
MRMCGAMGGSAPTYLPASFRKANCLIWSARSPPERTPLPLGDCGMPPARPSYRRQTMAASNQRTRCSDAVPALGAWFRVHAARQKASRIGRPQGAGPGSAAGERRRLVGLRLAHPTGARSPANDSGSCSTPRARGLAPGSTDRSSLSAVLSVSFPWVLRDDGRVRGFVAYVTLDQTRTAPYRSGDGSPCIDWCGRT